MVFRKQNPFVGDYEIRLLDGKGRWTKSLSKAVAIYVRLPKGRKFHRFDIPKTKEFKSVRGKGYFIAEVVAAISDKRAKEARARKKKALKKRKKPTKPVRPKKVREEAEEVEDEFEEKIQIKTRAARGVRKKVISKKHKEVMDLEFMHYDLEKKIDVTPENRKQIGAFLKREMKKRWYEISKSSPQLIENPFLLVVEHEAQIKDFNEKTGKLEPRTQHGFSRRREELGKPSDIEKYLEDYFNANDSLRPGWLNTMEKYLQRLTSSNFYVKGFYFEFKTSTKKLI